MKKRPALLYLQYAWASAAIALVVQSVGIAWLGTPAQVSTWAALLPQLSTLVLGMGAAAAGGPLASDAIKAKAGKLEGE